MLHELLKYNETFVAEQQYKKFDTDKYPKKNLAILSCMDTRLTELLPAALGLKNGDANIITNAGGIITNPLCSTIRSLLVSIYELKVTTIMVIGHTDCGTEHMTPEKMNNAFLTRGISKEKIDMMDYCNESYKKWLSGFESLDTSVSETVKCLRDHPLIPDDVVIMGFKIDTSTGLIKKIC